MKYADKLLIILVIVSFICIGYAGASSAGSNATESFIDSFFNLFSGFGNNKNTELNTLDEQSPITVADNKISFALTMDVPEITVSEANNVSLGIQKYSIVNQSSVTLADLSADKIEKRISTGDLVYIIRRG